MEQVTTFNDWIMVGGQNGLIYFQLDNVGRVYRQTFSAGERFHHWKHEEGRLFWMGDYNIYEIRENQNMPGFVEFVQRI